MICEKARSYHRQCVMLMAHYLQDKVVQLLQEIADDCAGKYDVWLLYDNTRSDFDASLLPESIGSFLFDLQMLSSKYFMNNCDDRGRVRDGNTTFPIQEFFLQHPWYDHYWRIEYDVRFEGNWAELFDYFYSSRADLLTTTLYRYAFRPEWVWWKTLRAPRYVFKVDRIRAFLPIARHSAAAMDLLARNYGKRWQGHDEVVVPSLLYHYRFTIEDMGGDGEFVKPENRNRFYLNTPGRRGLVPGTMVCPPEMPDMPMLPGKMYHAIK